MKQTPARTLRNKPSLTTEKGWERVHAILRAARKLLATDGYAGLSMRRVAAEAGMTLSNVQHYYASREALLESVLMATMDAFQARMDRISAEMSDRPRLDQFLSTTNMFLEEITDPGTHVLLFEIRALASRNAFASSLMDRMLERERETVYNLIRGLNPAISDEEYMQRAILMVAQIEGLMLFRLDRALRSEQFMAVRAAVRKALLNLATVP
jgi:AcrR family transcriptional regulator